MWQTAQTVPRHASDMRKAFRLCVTCTRSHLSAWASRCWTRGHASGRRRWNPEGTLTAAPPARPAPSTGPPPDHKPCPLLCEQSQCHDLSRHGQSTWCQHKETVHVWLRLAALEGNMGRSPVYIGASLPSCQQCTIREGALVQQLQPAVGGGHGQVGQQGALLVHAQHVPPHQRLCRGFPGGHHKYMPRWSGQRGCCPRPACGAQPAPAAGKPRHMM